MLKLYELFIKFICLFIPQKTRRKKRELLLILPNIFYNNICSIPSYLEFKKKKNSEKSILMVEPNPYHFELMLGFYDYFKKLGFNIDIIAQPIIKKDSPFINITNPPKIFLLSPKFQKKALALSKTKDYEFIFLNTSVLWSDGVRDSYINWLGFEPKGKNGFFLVEHNVFPYVEQYGHQKYIEQGKTFTLRGLNNIPMLNPHFFGEIKNRTKSDKNIFSAIINEKDNIELLLTTCYNLIKLGVKNFEIIVTGRTVIKNIPEELKDFIKITGKITFKKLWKIYEKSDFIIPLLNPDIGSHDRYKEGTTTGTWQTMLGFKKPILIHHFFADFYRLDSSNAVVYETNSELHKAMKDAINMDAAHYTQIQKNIEDLEKIVYKESLENLEKSISFSKTLNDE